MSRDLDAIDQPTVHHEESDVNVRAIFGFGVGLFVVAVVVHLAVWGLFRYFDRREAARVTTFPVVAGEARLPPEPRLQVEPRRDLQTHQAQEDAILNGYSWVNKEAGIVRIPIADAMKRTLERGLPSRPAQEGPR
jgi:hypothetical protein